VSGYHLKIHITDPQLIAANTGHAFSLSLFDNSALRTMPAWGWTRSRANASMTRAKTYMTICWFTEEILPLRGERRPKTRYPPRRPARKVSYGPGKEALVMLCSENVQRRNYQPSFPGSEPKYFSANIVSLYIDANLARFAAWVRVALKMRVIFSFSL